MTPIPGYAIKISQFGFFFRLVSVKIVLGDFVPVFNTRNVNFKRNTLYKETNKKKKKMSNICNKLKCICHQIQWH